jgi:hypothetical protein
MKYISVLPFWVFEEIKAGKTVYALDRRLRRVECVNDITAEDLVAVMKSAEAEPTRYEFWYEEAEPEAQVTEETEDEDG